MSQSTLIKALQEKVGAAYSILEDCHRLMAKLGSENGSSPALRKKGGLSEEQKLKARQRRTRIINR